MRTVYLVNARKNQLIITAILTISFLIILHIQLDRKTFDIIEALSKPDRQLNESLWGYPPVAFPRASMIDVQYHMPNFNEKRLLQNPKGRKDSGDWSQDGQSLYIDQLLNGKENGFYVEVGADDGENYSNSLFFEVFRQWSGILIEPNQESFAKMIQLNRKALHLNSCISSTNLSEPFTFVINPFDGHNTNFLGGISEYLEITQDGIMQAKYEQHFANGDMYQPLVQTIRCTPLVDLIPEHIKVIDYLSLDTEGSELQILKNIQFDQIKIEIISIDVSSITGKRRDEGFEEFLSPLGYKKIKKTLHDDIYQLQQGV